MIPEILRHWLARLLQMAEIYGADEEWPPLIDEDGVMWSPPNGTPLLTLAEQLNKARHEVALLDSAAMLSCVTPVAGESMEQVGGQVGERQR